MRILLIASGAREHAVAEAFARSPQQPDVFAYAATRNPGIRMCARELQIGNLLDFPAIVEFAKKVKPDFAFVGPDDPIGAGLADELEAIGIPSVAPKKALARIESSKGFTRDLLQKYGIDASPKYRVFTKQNEKSLSTFIEHELGGAYVVKYDALKGGKGVKVSGDHLRSIDEGIAYAKECIAECEQVVVEEKLEGVEFSLLSFVSGETTVDMPAVQDHKRAYDGDTGPNTGGMGTYTDSNHSLPFLTKEDLKRASEINRLVAAALKRETGEDYKGILYGGFMAVRDGIRVIEYNARFGDPEALNILPLLRSDFLVVCQAILEGTLATELVRFEKKATVCKYITPKSYPIAKDERGQKVEFPRASENARIFFGDVTEDESGNLLLGGSRSAGVVGIGDTIAEAELIAQRLCEQVKGPVRFRSDIGTGELIAARASLLTRLRSGL